MLKTKHKTRLLQLFYLLGSLYLIVVAPQQILLGLVAYVFLETFAGNIGLHRYFGHRSFHCKPWVHNFLLFLGHYIGVGSVLSWVGQHRYHHMHSDTPEDVHSPYFQGLKTIFFGQWSLQVKPSSIKELTKDKTLVFWHRNYFKFHALIVLFWIAVDNFLGTYYLLTFYCFPNLMCLFSGYVLAVITHWHGYRTYETNDRSTNSWIANILTLGEGWHNNHHANPQRLFQGEKWYEWDLPALVIKYLLATKKQTL